MDKDVTATSELNSLQRVCSTFTKEEFLRDLFIRLTKDKHTPTDILSSTFAEIEEHDAEYLAVNAEVDIQFSCRVGNDRKEEYWDKEKYTENGVTKYRDVKKTRTVTDWSPYNGSNKSKELVAVRNTAESDSLYSANGESEVFFSTIRALGSTAKGEDLDTAEITVNREAVKSAKELCMYKSYLKAAPKCDHRESENYWGNVEINRIDGLILPEYELEYTYGERKFNARSFGCGMLFTHYDAPDVSSKINKIGNKKALWFLAAAGGMFVLALILAICGLTWFVLPFILSVGLVVAYFVFKRIFKNSLYNKVQNEKKELLIKALKDYHLAELSATEL